MGKIELMNLVSFSTISDHNVNSTARIHGKTSFDVISTVQCPSYDIQCVNSKFSFKTLNSRKKYRYLLLLMLNS